MVASCVPDSETAVLHDGAAAFAGSCGFEASAPNATSENVNAISERSTSVLVFSIEMVSFTIRFGRMPMTCEYTGLRTPWMSVLEKSSARGEDIAKRKPASLGLLGLVG